MTVQINPFIEELSYQEARPALFTANPTLCQEIDRLPLDDRRHRLLKITYHYGDLLLKKGQLYVPDAQGRLVKRLSNDCPARVQELLKYDLSMPMALALNAALELFVDHPIRPTPFVLGRAGHIFGLAAVLEPQARRDLKIYWSISAGARSVFILPKISHNTKHDRLCKRLGIHTPAPRTPYDDFELFGEISKTDKINPWTVEVLFFSNDWLSDRTTSEWRNFREYLHRALWNTHSYRVSDDLYRAWLSEVTMRYKPSPHFVNTVEHFIHVALGQRLGHSIATDDSLLPLSLLQQVYTEDYQLKEYRPEIMVPAYLTADNILFYSLLFPARPDFSHAQNKDLTQIEEIIKVMDLQRVVERALAESLAEDLGVMAKMKEVQFQGVHTHGEKRSHIISTETVAKLFPSQDSRKFPLFSSFLCGSVMITQQP